jgi:uncharacterized protein (TIGR03000 family)
MTRRNLVFALPALALTCLLLLPEPSFAQFRGGRGWGGWGGGYGGYGGWGGWGQGYGGWYGGYGYPGYSGYYGGYSPYWSGYSMSPYAGYNYTQPFTYSQPVTYAQVRDTGYAPVVPAGYQSFYPQGGTQGQQDNRAFIHVRVPPNAQVFFDDTPTKQSGPERNFVTPPLDGKNYSYDVSARWTDNNGKEQRESRTVRLTPGQSINVDFMTSASTNNNQLQQVPRSDQERSPTQNNPNKNQPPRKNPPDDQR